MEIKNLKKFFQKKNIKILIISGKNSYYKINGDKFLKITYLKIQIFITILNIQKIRF